MGGSLWAATPKWAERDIQRILKPCYRRGLALEYLRDFERDWQCPPDHSERMIRAAGVLLGGALPAGMPFFRMTPQNIIQSRTCQLLVRCDLEPTHNGTMIKAGTSPPDVVLVGALTQRIGLQIEVNDTTGGTALGQAKYRWSLNNGTTYEATGVATASAFTQLGTTGIYVSFAAGPYTSDNSYTTRLSGLNDQSGQGGDRDFVNDNVNTSFAYTANNSNIRNRASMASLVSATRRFTSNYNPAAPGTANLLIDAVINAAVFTNTGRIFSGGNGTGAIDIRQANPSPEIAMVNITAVNTNTGLTVGTWLGFEALFTNSTSDRLRCGTTATTGANAGNTDPTGFALGARIDGALPSTTEYAEVALFTGGDPTAAELARNRARKTLFYGVTA
jgi:hypothetical protein